MLSKFNVLKLEMMRMAKAKNILLMFLSTMNLTGKDEINLSARKYRCLLETGEIAEDCVQTNEAVVYDVVNLLQSRKESLDAIFFFATDKVQRQTVRIVDGKTELYASITQREFLERRWKARCEELSGTQFHCVDYSYPTKDAADADTLEVDLPGESSRRVTEMAEAVKSLEGPGNGRGKWNTYELYVDITGGFRHATMMMTSLVQLLQYNGMKLKKLLYSDFQPGRALNKVFDFTEIGRQYRLITGAEEFARFGSVYNIEKYFGAFYDPKNGILRMETDATPELKSLLLAMHQFSDAIHLCATNKIKGCMDVLRQSVTAFRDNRRPKPRENLFRQLLDIIYEEYGALLRENARETDVIRWCLDKGFYQQALTLYVEWMPILFVREKILYPAREKDVIDKYEEAARDGLKGSKNYQASWQGYFVKLYPYDYSSGGYFKSLDAMIQNRIALVAQNKTAEAKSIVMHYLEINRMRNAVNHASAGNKPPDIDKIISIMQKRLVEIDWFCADVQKDEALRSSPAGQKERDTVKPTAAQEKDKADNLPDERKEESACASLTTPTTTPTDGEALSGQPRNASARSLMCHFRPSAPNGAKKMWRWRRLRLPGRSRPCALPPFSARGNPHTASPLSVS